MNTVVWILMIFSGHNWTPVIEFSTEQKCIAGGAKIDQERAERAVLGWVAKSWCMSIEK